MAETKLDMPNNLVTYLNQIPIYVVWCGSNNGYQKGIMCLKEIGIHAQNMITVLGTIVNITGGTYMTI